MNFLSYKYTDHYQVVDKGSATLGLPGTREKQIPVDADHRQICKFNSERDPRYQQVADNIISLMSEAVTAQEKRLKASESQQSSNISKAKGSNNSTRQTGKENRSDTLGIGNKISQVGSGNISEVNGTENITVQIGLGELDALKLAEMFVLNNTQSGQLTW